MSYIKVVIRQRFTDDVGNAINTTISRYESDMPMLDTYEMNLIWHALAIRGEVEIVNSCFGAGYWVNEKPWLNNEGWSNQSV